MALSCGPMEREHSRARLFAFIGTHQSTGIMMRAQTDKTARKAFSTTGRALAAGLRARLARAELSHCEWFAHRCGTNRLQGEQGRCRAGAGARVFSAQTEVSDELLLIPTFAIALSGCDLRCSFCITGKESWNARAGDDFHAESLAQQAMQALENGARTIMLLGGEPTIHLPDILDIIAALPDEAKLVWKTNAHASARARDLLDGMFDVWVADYKFGNDGCAGRLAQVSNYEAIVHENLIWAAEHSELIVRHLLMPGHVNCCWKPVARWIADHLPGTKVNLRAGFWPAWKAANHAELLGSQDYEAALNIARDCSLTLIE